MNNFRNVNLNLIPVLRELLRHRSVTNAAKALNVSQPAVSNALAQLRRLFHDELLIANGRALEPSALAERMLPRLEMMLGGLETFIAPVAYDPANSHGAIKIATADYVILLLGAQLINRLSHSAPGLTVEFTDGSIQRAHDLKMGDIDLFIAPQNLANPLLDWFSNGPLFEDEMVCVVRSASMKKRGISKAEFMTRKIVMFTPLGSDTRSFAEIVLNHAGINELDLVRVPNFLLIPHIVEGTETIGLLPRRLARRLAAFADVRTIKPPFEFPKLKMSMWWSSAKEHDPGHIWLRQLVRQSCDELGD